MLKAASVAPAAVDQLGKVRYIASFDGLRTCCIVAVILFHSVPYSSLWINNVAARGWCGVDVFFVLSGFLITWIIVSELNETATVNLLRFYGRRALRLQPAYFSGLFGFAALLFVFHRAKFHILLHAMPFFLSYSLNFAVALGFIMYPPYGPAWSLCIEEQFYLCWPWTLRRLGARGSLRAALALIGGVLVYRCLLFVWLNWGRLADPSAASMDRIYYGTDTRIDTLLVGCAAALALGEPSLQAKIQRLREWPWLTTVALIAALLGFGWATGGAFKGGWRAVTIGFSIMSISAAAVIVALFLQPRSMLARFLSSWPLVFVGKISYGVYLFHEPLWNGLVRGLHWNVASGLTPKQELTGFLVTLFGSIAIAWLHYRIVEQRFLALRSRLDFKVKIARPTLAASPMNAANS
jgi:peptidoglycan/LPS O-acetylase OafA/YrhL